MHIPPCLPCSPQSGSKYLRSRGPIGYLRPRIIATPSTHVADVTETRVWWERGHVSSTVGRCLYPQDGCMWFTRKNMGSLHEKTAAAASAARARQGVCRVRSTRLLWERGRGAKAGCPRVHLGAGMRGPPTPAPRMPRKVVVCSLYYWEVGARRRFLRPPPGPSPPPIASHTPLPGGPVASPRGSPDARTHERPPNERRVTHRGHVAREGRRGRGEIRR